MPGKCKPSQKAKCRAIPTHFVFFCQNLHKEVKKKFEIHADTIVAEFLFSKWLFKALEHDANKLGLVTNQPIKGFL